MPCLTYFVVCGVSRQARFNVTAASLADDTGKVKYFEGTPIPTSSVLPEGARRLCRCLVAGWSSGAWPVAAVWRIGAIAAVALIIAERLRALRHRSRMT